MSIKTWLWKTFLTLAIKNQCPSTIPRSGENGRKVDCLTIYINSDGNPYFLVDEINENILIGRRWDGNSFQQNHEMLISDVDDSNIEIWFYKGVYEYSYRSLMAYMFLYVTGIHRVCTFLEIIKDTVLQFFNNKRKVEALKRYDLLIRLKEFYSDGSSFSPTMFTMQLYSWRILRRPDYAEKIKIIRTQLEWLCEIGELKKNREGDYLLAGKLWESLSNYEVEWVRERNAKIHSWAIFFLTFIISLSALVQSSLIRLPLIYKLDSWTSIIEPLYELFRISTVL
ncbi:hypothetical protein ACW4YW_02180 [Methylobacillus pratensis]